MLADKRIASLKPMLPSFLGMLFCLWSARGNDVNFCATAGCSLYQDATVAGLSLWWYGAGGFALLALLALAAPKKLGQFVSACALLADTALLMLLAATAPCVNCLAVGALFALTYRSFRRLSPEKSSRISLLLSLWLIFFTINLWAVVKSAMGPWPVYGDPKEATIHIYFSPSCPHCRDVVSFYSGNLQAVFYPVTDKAGDIGKILTMQKAIHDGSNIEKALSLTSDKTSAQETWSPSDSLLTSFRCLLNKAHIFLAGSSGIPFIEYRGMPSIVARELKRRRFFEEEEEQTDTAVEVIKVPATNPPSDALPPELLGTEQQCTHESCP